MRHRKSINHLGRTSAHRKAMLANLASSLILHKKVTTTVAKAKALRMYVEPLITKAKEDSTHSRRIVFSLLQNKEAVTELFREVSKKVGDRPGGYTRILKLGTRQGDNADMAYMELVDYNENLLSGTDTSKAKAKSRRGRSGSKKTSAETVTVVTEKVEPKVEKKKEEAAPVNEVETENEGKAENTSEETDEEK
ncbi:MAG: 50S ribosomal protein L17 [Bacteroidales bacterium]|nr:50S ribosomal protein L17 [Bacteroidales bacterium]